MKNTSKHKGRLYASLAIAGFLTAGSVSQGAVLLHETFNNGLADQEMEQPAQLTSDGNGHWFGSFETYYRGSQFDLRYEIPFTMDSPVMKIRALNYSHNGDANGVDTLSGYIVRIGTIQFEGWNASSAAFIRPRVNDAHLGYGYRFSPNGTANPPAHWNVYYVGEQSTSPVLVATLPGASPVVENNG